jgi:membrane peptidoglycan carboxypeptidase
MGRATLFVGCAVLAGLLAAGMALPFVGTAGMVARGAAKDFELLPTVLETPALPEQSTILAADGTEIAKVFAQNRVVVPLEQVAPVMREAIVAIEDERFYEHKGVDLQGTVRAALTNRASGEIQQGGSTITQQYVKNLLITAATNDDEVEAAREATVARKLREMRYAIGLEKRYSKDEILQGYLNVAYFGAGAYGIEAASRRYFSKSAAELGLPEAATLAGVLQQPVGFDPTRNPEASQGRRDVVLNAMRTQGYITDAEYQAAVAVPIASYIKVSETPNGCATALAPYFCDYVLNILKNDPTFGATETERAALLRRGGLTITTTLDIKAQQAAQNAADSTIPRTDPSGRATAIVSVEPGSGAIKAMAQNRSWGVSGDGVTTYNYSVDRAQGGTIGMQAGSTFKVFTLAAALESRFSIGHQITVPRNPTFTDVIDCVDGRKLKPYSVRGAGGTFDLRTGTWKSNNPFYVTLSHQVGVCKAADVAERLGVRHAADQSPLFRYGNFTLGQDEVSPLSMAEAYATFAARGLHCDARALVSVVDRTGVSVGVPQPACNQVMEPGIADAVTDILTGVIDGPDPGRTGEGLSLGRPAAGKTGTTNGNAAVWFVGYTPELSTAVWVGDPRGGTKYPMANVTINGRYYREIFGATLPGPIWKQTMLGALDGVPGTAFAALDPRVVVGLPVEVPRLYGKTAAEAQALLAGAGLVAEINPDQVRSTAAKDSVAYTSPGSGARVDSGSVVSVRISNGVPPPPPPPPVTPPPVDPNAPLPPGVIPPPPAPITPPPA